MTVLSIGVHDEHGARQHDASPSFVRQVPGYDVPARFPAIACNMLSRLTIPTSRLC
jgi:hypothetical protein